VRRRRERDTANSPFALQTQFVPFTAHSVREGQARDSSSRMSRSRRRGRLNRADGPWKECRVALAELDYPDVSTDAILRPV